MIIETDSTSVADGGPADLTQLAGCHTINDGATHVIVVRRTNGVLQATVDGVLDSTGTSTSYLGALAPLQIGTGVCVGVDSTVPIDTSNDQSLQRERIAVVDGAEDLLQAFRHVSPNNLEGSSPGALNVLTSNG